uniref:Uncharacterized protein n=1 Tax=Schizaphis graminum TaxID=13262 RepID=A0A2S2PPP2_SCHGA
MRARRRVVRRRRTSFTGRRFAKSDKETARERARARGALELGGGGGGGDGPRRRRYRPIADDSRTGGDLGQDERRFLGRCHVDDSAIRKHAHPINTHFRENHHMTTVHRQ